jgi:hypothetical protein
MGTYIVAPLTMAVHQGRDKSGTAARQMRHGCGMLVKIADDPKQSAVKKELGEATRRRMGF